MYIEHVINWTFIVGLGCSDGLQQNNGWTSLHKSMYVDGVEYRKEIKARQLISMPASPSQQGRTGKEQNVHTSILCVHKTMHSLTKC